MALPDSNLRAEVNCCNLDPALAVKGGKSSSPQRGIVGCVIGVDVKQVKLHHEKVPGHHQLAELDVFHSWHSSSSKSTAVAASQTPGHNFADAGTGGRPRH